jgi:hypothetical protein
MTATSNKASLPGKIRDDEAVAAAMIERRAHPRRDPRAGGRSLPPARHRPGLAAHPRPIDAAAFADGRDHRGGPLFSGPVSSGVEQGDGGGRGDEGSVATSILARARSPGDHGDHRRRHRSRQCECRWSERARAIGVESLASLDGVATSLIPTWGSPNPPAWAEAVRRTAAPSRDGALGIPQPEPRTAPRPLRWIRRSNEIPANRHKKGLTERCPRATFEPPFSLYTANSRVNPRLSTPISRHFPRPSGAPEAAETWERQIREIGLSHRP